MKLACIGAITIVALLALGAIVSALSRNDETSLAPSTAGGASDAFYAGDAPAIDPVAGAIDKALGREPVTALPPPVANRDVAGTKEQAVAPAAPISRAGASTGAIAPDTQPGAAPLATVDDRKIVQTASLALQVKAVGESFEEVSRIVTTAGGFVASSNFTYQDKDQVASVTVRVPTARYQQTLADLRRLGAKIDSETSNASDITEEYTDLTARQRNLEATETRLLELIGRANNVSEILQVQDRLNSTRGEIERVKGRINLLDKLTDLATITVHLRPVVGSTGAGGETTNLADKVSEAWDASIAFLTDIAAGLITVIVFAWWLPLIALPAYLIVTRIVVRNRPLPAAD